MRARGLKGQDGRPRRCGLTGEPPLYYLCSHRYLPATALTFDGLAERPEPGEMILAANYPTADPEAERKRKKGYRQMLKREHAQARDGR